MNKNKISLLDCTFRDGGYYCDWNFDQSIVDKYLKAISLSKIEIVELGFRFMPQSKPLGHFAYCSENFLKTLNLPSGIDYAVMINASELISYTDGIDEAVNILFSEKNESPVDIVRIAAHSKDLEDCKAIAKKLKKLGYRVFLNIMQISSLDSNSISVISQNINSWDVIEVLYFADSLGDMESDSVTEVINAISKGWDGPIGIHTHDNKNQALSNSIKAIESKVTFIDATILGMGRGAGNARMEALLVEIISKGFGDYNSDPILPLVINDFSDLKNKYNWGPNIYYYLSAIHKIHPTYIQEMSGDKRYDTDQIISAINFLKSREATFYSFESMMKALSATKGSEIGSWSAKNWARAKDVLIVGSGPSTKEYLDDLINYINQHNPIVLCLNINDVLPKDLVTAYLACHQSRILIESGSYSDLNKPIILPLNNLPTEIKDLLKNTDVLNYGLKIQDGKFEILDKGCILEKSLVLNYALSLANASGAKRVLLTGIDGYEKSDPRQISMVKSIEKYKSLSNSIPIYALTPTTYPIENKSVYISNFRT